MLDTVRGDVQVRLLFVAVTAVASVLAGCASTEAGTAPAPAPPAAPVVTPSSSATSTPEAVAPTRIEVVVAGGKVTTAQPVVDVALGSPVLLVVTSDKADELHVHGYDKKASVTPGKPIELRFDATIPGVFEVETHAGHQRLVQLRVR